MALLTLKDIGKIYVSDGNVAVGIRGVNLSFDRGEFVAVTGKSGSGKSTLLNVISGMDTYEEGELYIESQTTSHYLQPEWEAYRQKYISFIFQDYNIIESFTVLQNVELALMHIEDKSERRKRALELLDRVGLTSHLRQKGSQLSGGQKQRTVIARALAKDSPIILADEPTGNLDSATSAEIIELLREVSKDKLLIVVTHNFEQVKKCATRHIRIFDGTVESDHMISRPAVKEEVPIVSKPPKAGKPRRTEIRNGITLGRTIFLAKPKLSTFLCLLMVIGTLGVFLVTTLCGSAADLFDEHYMFEPIEGRVVLTGQNGSIITDAELQQLAAEYGAKSYLHYDSLLDVGYENYARFAYQGEYGYVAVLPTYNQDLGDGIIGRYPNAENEVLLYLPISYRPMFGKDAPTVDHILMDNLDLTVTGVKYYYDNNKPAKCLFTEEGFRIATAVHYLYRAQQNCTLRVTPEDGSDALSVNVNGFFPSFNIEAGRLYIDSAAYRAFVRQLESAGTDYSATYTYSSTHYRYNDDYYDSVKEEGITFSKTFDLTQFVSERPDVNTYNSFYTDNSAIISVTLLREIAEEELAQSYRQASLFFENDKVAHEAAERLRRSGYMAVPADTTYTPDAESAIVTVIASVAMAFVWVIAILFLAFFINLCSGRALGAFQGDMAIMRSMGIPVRVIRIGMYVRMLISLIPGFILVIITAILIFTTPKFNQYFVYLYAWQYALIFLGMLLLTIRTTHTQIRKLFGESVKRSLKGGDVA